MSSKKIRKKIRMERIKLLYPMAMQLYAKSEQDRLYLQELNDIPLVSLSNMEIVIHMLRMKYFGYAQSLYQRWLLGFTKYNFKVASNGKIRAKNIVIT